MLKKTLHRQKKKLANSKNQLKLLSGGVFENENLPTFKSSLEKTQNFPLKPSKLEILQINLGYMCNQVCAHCHVDAGPDRKEIMSKSTLKTCLNLCKSLSFKTLDLTGGAPEMNPNFKWFVEEANKIGFEDFIVRSNLTIIMSNKKFDFLPEFFKSNNIRIISSLPHWTKNKTDNQRGEGVFINSIEALKKLNNIGYGKANTNLKLDLVYNPSGAFLPGDQISLEKKFKKELQEKFEIEFNNLLTITNLPVSRFLDYLIASENYDDYMETLVNAYNPKTVNKLMCKNTLSVGWDGYLYDCDFNQMLNLKLNSAVNHIRDLENETQVNRNIRVSQHCYGCTAGSGSSCQGSVT